MAGLLATMLAIELVAVQPFLGRSRYRRLRSELETKPGVRLHHYRRSMLTAWLAVGVVAVIGLLAGRHPSTIGLRVGPDGRAAVGDLLAFATLLALSAIIFRFGGRDMQELLRRQARGFVALLPRSREERLTFVAVAVTAGVCEEILFRGFGIAYVRWLWPSASKVSIVLVIGAAFGLAHLYQGARGVVLTAVVGAYFAWLTLTTGSLLPAIVMHALLDLRVLALPDLEPVTASAEREG